MALRTLSEVELLQTARNGDEAAFTELYVRHHAAARRLAGSYRRGGDADDLVNGAFERVLGALRRGGGPSESFRAYLFVTLRRLAMETADQDSGEPLDDVPEPVLATMGGPELERAEREMVSEAFESLPGRWQTVLWHTAVEGRQPREIAGVVGLSANAAAALAYRARERLRQAYLQAHLRSTPRPRCEPHRSRLGGYVRHGLSHRDHRATTQHLEHCESCQSLVTELTDVNRMLVRSVAPVFLLGSGGKIAGLTSGPAVDAAAALGAASSAPATAGTAGSTSAAGAAGAGDVATGIGSHLRRAGVLLGTAGAAAAVALTFTVIPHDGGPGSRPDASWEAGPPPSSGPLDDVVNLGENRPAKAGPVEPTPDSSPPRTGTSESSEPAEASPGADEPAAPTTTTEDDPLLGADATVGVDLGDGLDVQVEAQIDIGLDLTWVRRALGSGTLEILVPNDGTAAVGGLEVDVQLSSEARTSTLLSGSCHGSSGGLLGTVLTLVRSLTCDLGSLDAGARATTRLDVQVAGGQQTATVSVRLDGEVLARDQVPLPT